MPQDDKKEWITPKLEVMIIDTGAVPNPSEFASFSGPS